MTKNQLLRSTPEAQGISSAALLAFVEALEGVPEMHSLMLLRHGCAVAEGWWAPYGPARPHMLFSLTKSFTSTAIGLAVAEGRLSVDDLLLSFFPDEAPAHPDANLAQPEGAYRGDGAFGQYCVVLPAQDAVLAITSAVDDLQSVLDVVWEKLLPAFEPAP